MEVMPGAIDGSRDAKTSETLWRDRQADRQTDRKEARSYRSAFACEREGEKEPLQRPCSVGPAEPFDPRERKI